MDETLRQLGELLLASIPTIFGLVIVWIAYRVIVHGKLEQVLGERRSRTEGAIHKAQSEIASAEARTAEYEQKVREARAQIYAQQEASRRRMLEERNKGLAEARKQAESRVNSARVELEKEALSAKEALQKQATVLADQIIASVLGPAAAAGGR